MTLAAPAKEPASDLPARTARILPVQRHVDYEDGELEPSAGRCACGGECPACRAKLQPKLDVSTPGDYYEREADRTADAVMASAPLSAIPAVSHITPLLSPSSSTNTNDGAVMRSAAGECADPGWHDCVAARLDAAAGGAPLPAPTRDRMEHALGADFGGVRVHADAGAHELADQLGARAFTHGPDVYFAAGEYNPGTTSGDWLIAHELTHVVQQTQAPNSSAVHRVQRAGNPFSDAWAGVRTTVRSGAAAVAEGVRSGVDTVSDAAGTVRDVVVDVARSARDLIEGFLEENAPGVLAFLRGDIIGEIKRRIYAGLDYLFNGLGERIRTEGLTDTMRNVFGEFVEGVSQIASDLADGRCESLFAAMRMIGEFGERLTGPAFQELREIAGNVASFFSDLWNQFGAPAAEAIQQFAGEAWTWITEQARWLWDQTEGVRRWFSEAWEEYKRRFNIAWNDAGSVLEDLQQKAVTAWEQVKRDLGPWLVPLEIAAGLLLLISPLGPIVLVAGGGYALWEAIGWIRQHWDEIEEAVVTARQFLHDHVLARIISDLEWLQGGLVRARDWIGEQVTSLLNALNNLADALGLTPMLGALRRVIGSIVRGLIRAAEFISREVRELFGQIRDVALEVHRQLRPFYGLIAAIILFPQFPFLLPVVLTGWAWRLSPDCIKPPIIDFALDMIIRGVRAVPEFRNFGDAWAQGKEHIIASLERARAMDFPEKVRVSDRVARMMTGEDIEWIGNLIEAARNAPDHFVSQAQEELIGMNLDNPLPFERTGAPPPPAPGAIDHAEFNAAAQLIGQGRPLAEGDIQVEPVHRVVLEPELQTEIVNQAGRTGDGLTIDDGGADAAEAAEAAVEARAVTPSVEPGTSAEIPPAAAARPMTLEEQTEAQLDQMIAQPLEESCDERPTEGPATQAAVPDFMRIGPLTQMQRGRYLFAQMRKAISHWFRCNMHWVVPLLIVGTVAFIAAVILTEGAILAALMQVMQVLAPIFLGIGAIRIAYFVGEYVGHAIAGDVLNASKSLARALAATAVELAFAVLFNLKSVIRQAGRAVREVAEGGLTAARRLAGEAVTAASSSVRRTVGGALEAASQLPGTLRRGLVTAGGNIRGLARAVVRNGRVILGGLEEGFARGIRSIRGLIERIRQWFRRFRRFRIRFTRRWLIFEGEINPWVRIFEAEIQIVDSQTPGARFLSDAELDAVRRAQVPNTGDVRAFEAAIYRETTTAGRGVRGDRLTGDHIPSRAALERALLAREQARLNRPLVEAEIRAIHRRAEQEGITVVLRDLDHQTLSRTYAGRNNAAQIALDAADLGGAFRRDCEAILTGLRRDGRLTNEVVGAYLEAYRQNVARGIFQYDSATDALIQSFLR